MADTRAADRHAGSFGRHSSVDGQGRHRNCRGANPALPGRRECNGATESSSKARSAEDGAGIGDVLYERIAHDAALNGLHELDGLHRLPAQSISRRATNDSLAGAEATVTNLLDPPSFSTAAESQLTFQAP